MQKTNQEEFWAEKLIKSKCDKLYIKWKRYDDSFNSLIGQKDIIWMSEYFPKPKFLGGNVKVELNLSNYVTKADLKQATGVDTLKVAKTVDLTGFKSEIDKLDIEKLETTPADLSTLSDVKNEVVKETVNDELLHEKVTKTNTTATNILLQD